MMGNRAQERICVAAAGIVVNYHRLTRKEKGR